jgi:hypothetical protein
MVRELWRDSKTDGTAGVELWLRTYYERRVRRRLYGELEVEGEE